MTYRTEQTLEGRRLSIETGRVARAADGAAWVRYGDTVVLVTAVASKQAREGIDFFPLTVDYQERFYAAGKIPGGFFKREGRPHEKETLSARLIDRSIRPLFPAGYHQDVQIIATVLSVDQENDPDVVAVVGASAALGLSPIPFLGPIGCVRVARVGGRLILNPTYAELGQSDLDMVVSGTEDAIVMVEGGAREATEEVVQAALMHGHRGLKSIIAMQRELARQVGVQKVPFVSPSIDPSLQARVEAFCRSRLRELVFVPEKEVQQARRKELLAATLTELKAEEEGTALEVKEIFDDLEKKELRRLILEEGKRADGRATTTVRPITCEVGVLPRTHGSALFTRGQTQALVTTTLGTSEDEQRLDDLEGESSKRFMLHYNFPPFSVGEVKFIRGASRRDIGHGNLAERAIHTVLPSKEEFPYTVRIVSDILESNGSSSMATVCGASLALMDAGVPVRAAVAGVAMGLVKEGERTAVLTDIQGLEDHLGDMDFKVAGTRAGVTSIQMDIKLREGVTEAVLQQALGQARAARLEVLDIMDRTLAAPRAGLSPYAPRILSFKIPVDKIREVIGPGGKIIRGIVEQTGAKIDIEDDGTVAIASVDEAAARKAMEIIGRIVEVPEVGKVYQGRVVKITDFGAFVEILPGTDGLLHISQIAAERIKRVEDVLKEGQEIQVKVIEVDKAGKIRLSRRELLREAGEKGEGPGPAPEASPREEGPPRPHGGRGGHGGEGHRDGSRPLPQGGPPQRDGGPDGADAAPALGLHRGLGAGGLAPRARRAGRHLPLHRAPVLQGHRAADGRGHRPGHRQRGGTLDAFTSREHTCLYAKVLGEHLPLAVDLLSDLLLHPRLDPADIEKERRVVLEEIKMVEDDPDDLIHDLFAAQFWREHPLGRPVLGSRKSLGAVQRQDVLEHLRDYYQPDRVVVAAAGDVDHDRLVGLLGEAFRDWTGTARVPNGSPPIAHLSVSHEERDSAQLHMVLGVEGLPYAHPDRYAFYLLNGMLGSSMSSRLFQEVREKRGLAYSIYSYQASYQDTGLLAVYAGTSREAYPQVLELIRTEFGRLRGEAVNAEEFARAKAQLKGNLLLGLESSSSRMTRLAKTEIYFQRYFDLDEIIRGIDRVTPEQFRALTASLLQPERYALATIGPLS